MKRILIITALLFAKVILAQDNSNWGFVGPKCDATSGFTPERVNCIAVDPRSGFTNNYFAAGVGGVWMSSYSGTNWTPIDPGNKMYYSGASAMAVDPSNGNVYIASSSLVIGTPFTYAIYKLQSPFGVQVWSTLGALPSNCLVYSLQFNPSNNNYLYACTSLGLYVSTNKGVSWTNAYATATYNIAFVNDGGTTFCFATGNGIFLWSTNGTTFSNDAAVASNLTNSGSWTGTTANICTGDISTSTKYFYVFEYTGSGGDYAVFQISENGGAISSSSTPLLTLNDALANGQNTPDRLALAYAQAPGLLVCGGTYLTVFDVHNNVGWTNNWNPSGESPYLSYGAIIYHTDNHYAVDVPSSSTILEGSDGGVCAYNYSGYNYLSGPGYLGFGLLSYGLNISQIHGFSGAADENFYVQGDQDALNGWKYDASADMATSTQGGTEPDGGLVSKFNHNDIIMNYTVYGEGYSYSTDAGNTFNSTYDNACNSGGYQGGTPVYGPASGTTFEANLSAPDCEQMPWGVNTLFQDPSRRNMFYYGSSYLDQWDSNNNVFAIKFNPSNLNCSGCNTNAPSTCLTCCDWQTVVVSVAMSPYYKNGLYFTTLNRYYPAGGDEAASQVIKFIGPNVDDCWNGHNDDAAHWKTITPNFSTVYNGAPFNYTFANSDIFNIYIPTVVVSTWDPNRIWVGCNTNTNKYPLIKVLTYFNGMWSDYSTGIPANETVVSMVMEIGTNDGIYLGTDRAVYYRNASMPSWQIYSNVIPHLIMNQLEVNYVENTLRSGTYGQGIWKTSLNCPLVANPAQLTNTTSNEYDEASQALVSTENVTMSAPLADGWPQEVINRAGQSVLLKPGFRAVAGSNFTAFIHPCSSPGNSILRKPVAEPPAIPKQDVTSIDEDVNGMQVYPNPSSGSFTIKLLNKGTNSIVVYNMLGEQVFSKDGVIESLDVNLADRPKGVYFIRAVNNNGSTDVKKVVLE